MLTVFQAKIVFCLFRDKKIFQKVVKSNFWKYIKSIDASSQKLRALLASSKEIFSKLTFGQRAMLTKISGFLFLRYRPKLSAFLGKKTANFQFSPKMCSDKGESANLRMTAVVSAKLPAILKQKRRISKRFQRGFS